MTRDLDRRDFLRVSAGSAAALALGSPLLGCQRDPPFEAPGGWDAGGVAHLLPTAEPTRIRLSASFREPVSAATLLADGAASPGVRTDSAGFHYAFEARGLAPGRAVRLELRDATGAPLCDAWPLHTAPSIDAPVERFRLLAYTCAGGPEYFLGPGLDRIFRSLSVRQRLLARALSFAPDAVVANGDHVYWDLHSRYGIGIASSPQALWRAGRFDTEAAVLGGHNEEVLRAAVGPQIADLYGTLFRSVPVYFLQDDHDYLENDEPRYFPPNRFMSDVADVTRRLYYPALPGEQLPEGLRRPGAVGDAFGVLRWGRLFEALLYDCRRFLVGDVGDAGGGHFVPEAAERWLVQRSRGSDAQHLVHMPSTPVLWTAGKWGEWYPDVQDEAGALGVDVAKPRWSPGWQAQHDRLLAAAASRSDRTPMFVSGDLHATGLGRIHRSGETDLGANPVVSVLAGTPGTGEVGWPSNFRGQRARPSVTVEAEEWLEPLEENGFSLFDFTPGSVRIAFFRWKPEDGIDAIGSLQPFRVEELERRF